MALFPRGGGAHNNSSAAVAGTGAAGMSHLYPPRIACFVCGAEGPADYPIFAEPPHTSAPTPAPSSTSAAHFPFLLAHPPPMGCSALKAGDARGTKSCRPCHMALMRQWDDYQAARLPLTKRVYWRERVDGLGFISPETQAEAAVNVQLRMRSAPVMAAPVADHHSKTVASSGSVATAAFHLPSGTTMAQIVPVGGAKESARTPSKPPMAGPPPPEPPTAASMAVGDNDAVLDLSSGTRERENVKSRSSVASHVSAVSHHSSTYQQSEGTNSSTTTDLSDLTLPDKNASFEVCYICGDEFRRGTLSHTFAKQMNREPFYPSLMNHPRPPRSRPMDSSGRVQTCDECHNHLHEQWGKFEAEDLPHADRNYFLRKRPASATLDNATFVCYLCSLEYQSSNLRLLYSRPNSEREPYYPFIEQQKPPLGASPISPQGMVQVCNLCFKSTKEKHHGFVGADQPPPKKRRLPTTNEGAAAASVAGGASQPAAPPAVVNLAGGQEDDDRAAALPADVTCLLCRRKFSVGSFKFLNTVGPPQGGLPYFPFLTDLPRPDDLADSAVEETAGSGSRVRACQSCTTSLMNQWTVFQRENLPVFGRHYNYPSLSTGPRSVSSVRAHSPASQKSQEVGAAASAIVAAHQQHIRTRSNTLESRPRSTPHSPNPKGVMSAVSSAPPACHSPAISLHSAVSASAAAAAASGTEEKQSMAVPTAQAQSSSLQPAPSASAPPSSTPSAVLPSAGKDCTTATSSSSFYCFLCGLHSELSFARMLYSTAPSKKAPYFPFMKSHVPKNKAETLREDGTALVCTFCYHSVMVQWTRFNDSKVMDQAARKYNLNDYNCYVCGVTTYRKRIRALRVQDFPFLRHHKTRKGVITMENNEMVAVCLDCFDTLRSQFNESERYGIPLEKRQYNWMQIPPPPEESAGHILTPQERLMKHHKTVTVPKTTTASTSAAVAVVTTVANR